MKNAIAYPLWALVACAVWHLAQKPSQESFTTLNGKVVKYNRSSGAIYYASEAGWREGTPPPVPETHFINQAAPTPPNYSYVRENGKMVRYPHFEGPKEVFTESGWQAERAPEADQPLDSVINDPVKLDKWIRAQGIERATDGIWLRIQNSQGTWLTVPNDMADRLREGLRRAAIPCPSDRAYSGPPYSYR